MIRAGAHKVFDRGTQADSDQECIEWDACMHPGPGYNFPEKNVDARELVLMRADAGLPGAGTLLMQLLMQITTALYLAITLSSFDASSLFQAWQNQRES